MPEGALLVSVIETWVTKVLQTDVTKVFETSQRVIAHPIG
jgi:hypothetical protein